MRVKPAGPKKCIIAIVGEAPGETEELLGYPFAGASGRVLDSKLHMSGIPRQMCYITNVSKWRPSTWFAEHKGLYKGVKYKRPATKNDFSIFWNGTQPTQYLLDCKEELLNELCEVETNVILACGANAMWALVGKREISFYRGSVFQLVLPNGRKVKVIPTWHPANIYKPMKKVSPGAMAHIIGADIAKAKRHSSDPTFTPPKRNLIVGPTISTILEFINSHANSAQMVSYDIETTPGAITCISLAFSPDEAISIPTTERYWGNIGDLLMALRLVNKVLCRKDLVKIAQFMHYDFQYLFRFFSIYAKPPWFDTAIAQHACYPELPKGLDFLLSIYTDEMYYKKELKEWKAGITTDEKLWSYNARDAACTYEVALAEMKEMEELGVRHTFDYMMDLMEPLLFMMLYGMRFDKAAARRHKDEYTERLRKDEALIVEKYGEFNPNSPQQVLSLLKRLGLKPPMKDGRPTTNKKALEKLSKKSPELEKIISVRNASKFISTYIDVGLDPIDQRFRCTFNQTTAVTGRLSSSESVFWGVGNNSENWPKKLRDVIVPDPGLVITEADLKGAEAVVVAYLSEDPLLMKLFEEGSVEPEPGYRFTNVHCLTAYLIWHVTEEEVKEDKAIHEGLGTDTESMYYKGKKTRHSANYRGSWVTLSEELRIPAKEAKLLLQRFMDMSPNILMWHKEVEDKLKKNRIITTCLGRKRIFLGIWNQDLLRAAIAYEPQETVVHVLNLGLTRVYKELCTKHREVSLLNQVHDSLVIQHPPEMTEYIHRELRRLMSVPLTIKGRTFTIPVEIATSTLEKNNWRDTQECKMGCCT